MREDTPYEAARRAWSVACHLMEDLRSYCLNPTEQRDRTRDYSHLVQNIEEATDRLEAARDLLTNQPSSAPAPQELFDAIEKAESVGTDIQILTFVKYVRNPESTLMELRSLLQHARGT